MAKTLISIAAENTFTDPLNCPRDSVLITLNPTGGTAIGFKALEDLVASEKAKKEKKAEPAKKTAKKSK